MLVMSPNQRELVAAVPSPHSRLMPCLPSAPKVQSPKVCPMLSSLIGTPIADLDTPCLLVDLEALDANIAVIASRLEQCEIAWRPHAKAHKSLAVAHRLLKAGAFGITCAKLGEAEVYAAAGIGDILIANQVVGPIKTRRLAALARSTDVMVAVDSLANAREIHAAAEAVGSCPRVLIEVDIGMHRAGVAPGESAVELAVHISSLGHIRFSGVMGWEGHAVAIADPDDRAREIRDAVGRLLGTAEKIRFAGIPVGIVSCGGTGTFLTVSDLPGVTEIQAGGGIFGDTFYRSLDVPVQPALSLQATVTSRPTPRRIIVDAGRKSIDPSTMPPSVVGVDNVEAIALSAEHGTISLIRDSDAPRVGDRLKLAIGYSDQAVHLHEHLFAIRDERVEALWPIQARGRLQ